MISTSSDELKLSCRKLFGQMVETGVKLSDNIIELILHEEIQQENDHILLIIAKNQEISSEAKIQIKILGCNSLISQQDLTQLLKDT